MSKTPAAVTTNLRRIFLLWLATRALLSLWAFYASVNSPVSALPVWGPQEGWGWWERVLLAPWYRWDVEHFLKIATQGYRIDDGTLSFHPLYPLLGKAAGALAGGDELWGLFIVSNVCSLLFLIAFERLARMDLSREDAYRSCFYFLMLPTAFILFAPYTESLFLLCSALTLLMARRGRWWAAGFMGGLAALTRQQGILLLLPLAWELWEHAHRDWRKLLGRWRSAIALLLTPLGLAAWVVYRNFALGDMAFDWHAPYSLVYGLVISPSASHIVTDQRITFPWKAVWLALSHLGTTNGIDLLLGSCYGLLLIAGGQQLWRLRASYLLYAAVTIVVSFSLSTGVPYSYMGLGRHCLLAFPLAMVLATTTRSEIRAVATSVLGLLGLLGLSLLYVWKIAWVP